MTRSDAMILKSPDPPSHPDVFQENVIAPQPRPAKLSAAGSPAGLVSQSPPRSPSPKPKTASPNMQSKVKVHPGVVNPFVASHHLHFARRAPRHLGKSITLTTNSGVNSSSSSTTRSSSSGMCSLEEFHSENKYWFEYCIKYLRI